MSSTSARLLPTTWQLTTADVTRICGRPFAPSTARVLVADVEGLCRGALADAQRRGAVSRDLETGDWVEVLGFLFGEVIVLARRYDPGRRGIEFRPWLYERLRLRAVDATRWLYGRQGQHRVPGLVSADTARRDRAAGEGFYSFGDESAFDNRLDEASLVDPADRVDARGWLDATADRRASAADGLDSLFGGGRAEGGDRGAGAGARGRATGGVAVAPWVDCVACGWRNFVQAPNGVDRWHFETCSGCGADLEVAA
jgi:hypothetical protein